jgi:hypothetical protein
MSTLRDELDADFLGAAKLEPFVLTTVGGRKVWIHIMLARQVAQWWTWVFEVPGRRRTYDEQLVELWCRLCVGEDDKQLYPSGEDGRKLRELAGAGKAMAEFFTEAKRRNFLYETIVEEDLERNRFFDRQAVAKAAVEVKKETPLSDSYSGSQPSGESLTPTS